MKKYVILFFAALLLFGCKKNEVDLLMGATPEERISDSINKLNSTLVNAENGWIGVLNTSAAGAYGFYFDFATDGTLQMVMDGNAYLFSRYSTADEIKQSTFRVKHVMATSLLFDTYNYITLLQDPVPGVADGAPGVGYGSDVDFELVKYSANLDTVFLKGKRHGNGLKLYKATPAQKQRYVDGQYFNSISNTDNFFDPLGANYYEADFNGGKQQVQISINNSTKQAGFTTLDVAADTLISVVSPYAYTIDGIDFLSNLSILGKSFSSIRNENGTFYAYDTDNGKHEVVFSDVQIISLKYAIGGSIQQIVLPGVYNMPAGAVPLATWSPSFVTEWNAFVSFARNGGYNLTIGNGFYTFDSVNKRIDVNMSIYQGTTLFSATMRYTYDFTADGDIKFTSFASVNGNGGILVPYLNNSIHKKMLQDTFIMNYGVDANFGKLITFTSKEDPNYYFSMVIN